MFEFVVDGVVAEFGVKLYVGGLGFVVDASGSSSGLCDLFDLFLC